MPWLTQLYKLYPDNLVSVKRASDINELLHSGQHFDKLIVARETSFNHEHVLLAAAFKAQLICFPQDDGWQLEQSVEFYYPDARKWSFDTTFGRAFVAEPQGASWRVLHG